MRKTKLEDTMLHSSYEDRKKSERKHDKKISFWLTVLAYFVAVGISITFSLLLLI